MNRTTESTTTLTDFLLARIAEDEAGAQCIETVTYRDRWFSYPNGETKRVVPPHVMQTLKERLLAEGEAKRRIVAAHTYTDDGRHPCAHPTSAGQWNYEDDEPCATLAALALPYAGHPDYREEWRP